MYMSVKSYAGAGGAVDEMARHVQTDLVPSLRGRPGFRAYCCFASERGDAVAVRVHDDERSAGLADGREREWMASRMRDLPLAAPDVQAGPVTDYAPSDEYKRWDGRSSLPCYALVGAMDGVAPAEQAGPLFRGRLIPALWTSPGFRALYLARVEGHPAQAVAVMLFDTRENAMMCQDRAASLMREEMAGVVSGPFRIVAAGQIAAMAAA